MKNFLAYFFILISIIACRKKDVKEEVINPPIVEVINAELLSFSPQFPVAGKAITIILDAGKGNKGLLGVNEIYIHTGVITDKSSSGSDWKYLVYNDFTKPHEASKMSSLGNNKFSITFVPQDFYKVPSGEKILKMAMVFRNADGSKVARNVDGSDMYLPIYEENKLHVSFTNPQLEPLFDPQPVLNIQRVGEQLSVTGIASEKANLSLLLNGQSFAQQQNMDKITATVSIKTVGKQEITIKAINGSETAESTFSFIVGGDVETAALPIGTKEGVTILNGGKSAIFTLYAPQKQFVYLIGDFNSWAVNAPYAMKRTPDGKIWWLQIDNLTSDTEYAYQFLVDGYLRIADAYSEMVLDPQNDGNIPSINFPLLKSYPTGKTTGIVSVVKTGNDNYNWRVQNFSRPAKEKLVIYELHLRDFVKAANYTTLIDTLNHLSALGVNAIELMPINEFEGNSSWGYNPSFYFAPDKYYGTKSALKKLIDECHSRDIAVILDMVLNHSFGQSPMVQLYFDTQLGKPSAASPWFNTDAKHPYNVGYDFNHESEATKSFVKNVLKFWIDEYKVDGFRFDLSKGFTQQNSGTSESGVDAWSRYDASRVAIWKDYNNYIKTVESDNFYVILEHFAHDQEEKELAADGMMLWNNLNYNFTEASMGYINNSDLSRAFYTTHGFSSSANLITYMESHDEERMMFKNLNYGNSSGSYNIKNLTTALKRQEMAAAFLFSIPGPKMIWQFGELGYDISIDQNSRTGEKPILWDYKTQTARKDLFNAFSKFIKMKIKNNVFNTSDFSNQLNSSIKHIILKGNDNSVVLLGNFDVTSKSANITFPSEGEWIDFNTGQKITISGIYNMVLEPGEYHIYSKNKLD